MSRVASIEKKYDLEGYTLKKAQREDLKLLLEVCREHIEEVDDDAITAAFKLCYLSHEDMKRASGEPYYYHPVEVAKIVASEINIDDVSVIASLLHDTVEDTDVNLDDIRYWFGEEVAVIIDGVTKITGVFKSRDSKQAEAFMKLLLTMAEDIRVVLIKFADRLHNMRTIQHLKREKQVKIASETLDLYAPLAHRFGLFQIKNELEDLCFKAIDPTSFKFVARKLREKKRLGKSLLMNLWSPSKKSWASCSLNSKSKAGPSTFIPFTGKCSGSKNLLRKFMICLLYV